MTKIFFEAIGMSECSYYISHSKTIQLDRKCRICSTRSYCKTFRPETLEEVEDGEEGMICIGEDDPGLFLEYWQLEEETIKARHDGYFFTGDYAKKTKMDISGLLVEKMTSSILLDLEYLHTKSKEL